MTRLLILLAGTLLIAAPVWAQADGTTQPEGDNIVVTGRAAREPPSHSEVSRQARKVTDGGDFRHTPLARFEDPLCPGVMGLRRDVASLMVDRLRQNAKALDLWLASEGDCTPNFVVAFLPDAKGKLARLARSQGYLFKTLTPDERRALLAEDGPVRVWTITEMRTRDGMAVARGEGLANPPTTSTWVSNSKITVAIRHDITSVVVLFDRDQVKGKTLTQLADYATMRGLARTRPAEESEALDTILALFTTDSPPPEMTEFDRAYLASLYDGSPNIPGIAKILGVNRQLGRQAEAPSAATHE